MEEILSKIDKEIHLERERNEFPKDTYNNEDNIEKPVFHYDIPLDNSSVHSKILAPFTYAISNPGKNFRKSIIQTLNYWIKAPKHIENIVSETIYLVHNYSLIIDDIQDFSHLRRGQPCCHKIFGICNTINATCFLMAYNVDVILGLNDQKLSRIYSEIAAEVIRGQAMDIYWRDNFICPTEEEYKSMIMRKTGAIFFFANNILQYYSKENIDTSKYLIAISLFFQINDDYQNLCSDYFHDHKGFCEDIGEGKFSFPVVYVVNNYPEEGKIILDILRQKTQDIELKKYCKSLIETCGGIEYTRKVLKELKDTIMDEAERLGPNAYFNEAVVNRIIKQGI